MRAEPTRPAVRGRATPSPVQPPPSPPSRRPAVRGREPEPAPSATPAVQPPPAAEPVEPAPSATPEQQERWHKLKGLGDGAGRAWYYKSLGKVAPGVRPGEETSEQVGQLRF